MLERSLDRPPRGARLDREPELGVELAGGDVVVRVRLDTRGETQHHGGATAVGDDLTQEVELVVAVDDDGGPGPVGRLQVLDALVVAAEMDAVGRKIRFQREAQLAGGAAPAAATTAAAAFASEVGG